MYSLFVSHEVDVQTLSTAEMSRSRFLEYTSVAISSQLISLSNEAIDCIKSWPCILMQEGRGEELAYVVQISAIRVEAGSIKVNVHPVPCNKTLINDEIWKLRAELDIEQFEFNRNHWAFKDRDLFPILLRAGYFFDSSSANRFDYKQLPSPTRRDLLSARNVISEWSHTEIDDFLLEVGVSRLEATRTLGSRRDRANAIIEYAIANPAATTAENFLFSTSSVRLESCTNRFVL